MSPELLPQDLEHARVIAREVIRVLSAKPVPQPEWVSPREASIILGISASNLEARRLDGEGPRYSKKGPRLVRYRVADLHSWMEAGYVS